jgi:glycerophosphoryl diester phosphodiesterase
VALIYAHRGLHVSERENTVGAFREAVALGVDGVELDVRRSVDGHLIVHHDAIIDGVAISEVAYADLPDYVPTFEEALEACRGISVNVEIKNIRHASEPSYDESVEFARHVLDDLYRFEWAASALISCFDVATCEMIRSLDPSVGVGWLLQWRVEPSGAMGRAKDSGFTGVHPYFQRVDESTVARARELNLELNVWTVNDPGDIEAMQALGVDSIITDDPATAMGQS